MNTSSFNNSSIFNSSQGSVVCCKHEQQYKELYEEFSALRMEHRAVKNQVSALRGTRKGLEEENQLLKEFLGKKKYMIGELNKKIEENQRQICRLEDELRQTKQIKQEFNQQIKVLEHRLKDAEAEAVELREKIELQQRQTEGLKIKFEDYKIQESSKTESAIRQKQAQLERMSASLQSAIQGLSFHLSTKQNQNKPTIIISHSQKHEKSETKGMDNQLQNILRQIEHQKEETLTQLNGKERVIQDLSTKNSDLEAQLTNYRELFEQQMAKMDTIQAQLREKDVQVFQTKQTFSLNHQKEDLTKHIISKLTAIINNHLPECQSTTSKLLQLSASPSKKFQTQILLKELSGISNDHFSATLKQSIEAKQLQSMNRNYNELKENYELLLLKFATLQREYREVVEDNGRLIKFSSLSQYRVNRNVGSSRSKWKGNQTERCQNDKENRETYSNLRT